LRRDRWIDTGCNRLAAGRVTTWPPSSWTFTTVIASPLVTAVTVPGSWLRVDSFMSTSAISGIAEP